MAEKDPDEPLASEWALAKDELATRKRALRRVEKELQSDSLPSAMRSQLQHSRDRLEEAVDGANRRLQILSERRQRLHSGQQAVVQNIVVTGSDAVINSVTAGESHSNTLDPPRQENRAAALAEKRQDFHFNFLNRSLTQSNVMFWVSVAFMISGGAIVLACISLLAFRGGEDGIKWASGTVGAVFTTAGGILNRQARRKDEHITAEAKAVAEKIDANDRFEKATTLIERVGDPALKDRLKATAAMEKLGFNPDPDTMAQLLIPPHSERVISELPPGPGSGSGEGSQRLDDTD
jgi:hypothetical protein